MIDIKVAVLEAAIAPLRPSHRSTRNEGVGGVRVVVDNPTCGNTTTSDRRPSWRKRRHTGWRIDGYAGSSVEHDCNHVDVQCVGVLIVVLVVAVLVAAVIVF